MAKEFQFWSGCWIAILFYNIGDPIDESKQTKCSPPFKKQYAYQSSVFLCLLKELTPWDRFRWAIMCSPRETPKIPTKQLSKFLFNSDHAPRFKDTNSDVFQLFQWHLQFAIPWVCHNQWINEQNDIQGFYADMLNSHPWSQSQCPTVCKALKVPWTYYHIYPSSLDLR